MKTVKLFLFAVFLASLNAQSTARVDFKVFQAIKAILKDYFSVKEPKIDLYYFGYQSETLSNYLLQEKDLSFRVLKLNETTKFQVDFPSLFLLDSIEHFMKIYHQITWMSKNPVWYKNIIYVSSKISAKFVEILLEKGMLNGNQNIIQVVNDTTIQLAGNRRFSPKLCHVPHFETNNQFSPKTMSWQKETFFPEKYQNFYGCTLRALKIEELSSGVTKDLFETLAKALNFKLVRVEKQKNNYSDALQYLSEGQDIELIELAYFQNLMFSSYFKFSASLYTEYVTFTVPSGEPYSDLEKMFLMFDGETWICIGVFLFGGLLTIEVIKLMPSQVRNFVFGRSITSPTMNLADIFLNGGQMKNPGRNFARYMLIMFVMWSLIIRTCYQSKLYKNLQSRMRKPMLRSVDELNEVS